MKKKYRVQLKLDLGADIIVEAETKKEAKAIGEKILDRSIRPSWWEYGGQEAIVTSYTKKLKGLKGLFMIFRNWRWNF